MAGKTVAQMWAEFEAKVIPPDAGDVQRSEMKLAFYAGALTLFNAAFSLDPGDEPTTADLERVDALYREINDFHMQEMARRLGHGVGHG